MILTDRDRMLLGILGDFGILTTAQISSTVFSGVATTTVLRRLRILATRNLIRKIKGLDNGQSAWVLTSDGASLSGQRVPQKFVNKNTLEHDVTLSQVRLALKTVGLGEHWQPEHVIRRLAWSDRRRREKELSIVPDGIFVAKQKNTPKSIAVELELNLKSMSRYDEIFKRYHWVKSLWIIWYIVPNKNIGGAILKRWEKSSQLSGAYLGYSLLSDVLNSPWEMKWHFQNEAPLIRNCIQMTRPMNKTTAQVPAQALSTSLEEEAA